MEIGRSLSVPQGDAARGGARAFGEMTFRDKTQHLVKADVGGPTRQVASRERDTSKRQTRHDGRKPTAAISVGRLRGVELCHRLQGTGRAVMLISHRNAGCLAGFCDRVIVLVGQKRRNKPIRDTSPEEGARPLITGAKEAE